MNQYINNKYFNNNKDLPFNNNYFIIDNLF